MAVEYIEAVLNSTGKHHFRVCRYDRFNHRLVDIELLSTDFSERLHANSFNKFSLLAGKVHISVFPGQGSPNTAGRAVYL